MKSKKQLKNSITDLSLIKWLYLIQAITSFLFFYYGNGLFFYDNDLEGYTSTNSLYSSGSDDDIAIFINGVICSLSFIILLFGKGRIKLIKWVFLVSLCFQFLSLLLIQLGSLWVTIFIVNDIFLLLTFFAQFYIVIIMLISINRKSSVSGPSA